jgi:putative endonuclease
MGITADRGRAAESMAAAYLELIGYTVAHRNARLAGVEVDLVARDGAVWVLIEVKYRGRTDYGGAALAVDRSKRDRLMRAARLVTRDGAVRVDVIAIERNDDGAALRHVRNALTFDCGGF